MTFQMALRYYIVDVKEDPKCRRDETHIDLDVEVLEIESVLPDVDSDYGNQVQERVLIRSGGDLQTFGGGIQSLNANRPIITRTLR